MLVKIFKTGKGGKKQYFHGLAEDGAFDVKNVAQLNKLLFTLGKKAETEGKAVDWEMCE